MDCSFTPGQTQPSKLTRLRLVLVTVATLLALPLIVHTQVDLCGCATVPGLADFNSTIPATYPPGTVLNGITMTIPVPANGILMFKSWFSRHHIQFQLNA